MWWIPALVFVVTFVAGVMASARWLPGLAAGPVGGLGFFAVSGLVGAATGLAGLHVYLIVRALEESTGDGRFGGQGFILADGLTSILFECGLIVAAAVAVFMLSPPPAEPETEETPA